MFYFNKFLGDPDAAGPGPHLENHQPMPYSHPFLSLLPSYPIPETVPHKRVRSQGGAGWWGNYRTEINKRSLDYLNFLSELPLCLSQEIGFLNFCASTNQTLTHSREFVCRKDNLLSLEFDLSINPFFWWELSLFPSLLYWDTVNI